MSVRKHEIAAMAVHSAPQLARPAGMWRLTAWSVAARRPHRNAMAASRVRRRTIRKVKYPLSASVARICRLSTRIWPSHPKKGAATSPYRNPTVCRRRSIGNGTKMNVVRYGFDR
jgi:hypothetical protein